LERRRRGVQAKGLGASSILGRSRPGKGLSRGISTTTRETGKARVVLKKKVGKFGGRQSIGMNGAGRSLVSIKKKRASWKKTGK